MTLRLASFATLIAISFAAYVTADIAHEALGHGGACLLSGGRSLLVDTTFQECSMHSRWIDGAGPISGILAALIAWLAARRVSSQNLGVFFTLLFAYAAFWNVGYLVKSGIGYAGDWHFVIEGLGPANVWHIGIAVAGIALYIAAMRMLAAIWPRRDGMSSTAFAITAFLAAGALSATAGYFDPRGPHIILTDALPSSLASFGLVLVGLRAKSNVAVLPSMLWLIIGLTSAALFVAVLGPGIRS